MVLRMKNFNCSWGSLKDPAFRGVLKNQYIGGDCLKRGAWTVCWFKRGLGKKEGGWYPNAHYNMKSSMQVTDPLQSLPCFLILIPDVLGRSVNFTIPKRFLCRRPVFSDYLSVSCDYDQTYLRPIIKFPFPTKCMYNIF